MELLKFACVLLVLASVMSEDAPSDGKDMHYTTVPPEKQAKMESKEDYPLDESSGDVDLDLDMKSKVNETKELEEDKSEEGTTATDMYLTPTSAKDDLSKESVAGEESEEEKVTDFPSNVKDALKDTEDKELLPVHTTTPAVASTSEEMIIPVINHRNPVQSLPEEPEVTTTADKAAEKEVSEYESQAENVAAPNADYLDTNEDDGILLPVTEGGPSAEATRDEKLSRGAVVGLVVVGVALLLVLIVLLVYLLVFRRRGKTLRLDSDDEETPHVKENGVANGSKNEESMTAFVKELKENKLSEGKDKKYGTELKDDSEGLRLNGTANKKNDSSV